VFVSATELAALVRQKKLSPVELVELYLRRIERLDPALNCFVLVTAEEALGQAKRAEEALAREEELGPFHGVPISIKDVLLGDVHADCVTAAEDAAVLLEELGHHVSPAEPALLAPSSLVVGRVRPASHPHAGRASVPDRHPRRLSRGGDGRRAVPSPPSPPSSTLRDSRPSRFPSGGTTQVSRSGCSWRGHPRARHSSSASLPS
jgi:hypothetical protein